MVIEVFRRKDDRWDWRFVGENGEQMGGSVQGFTERNDAREAVSRVVSEILTHGAPEILEEGKP